MKIRSSTACFGICMRSTPAFQPVGSACQHMPEPDGDEPGYDRHGNIRECQACHAAMQQAERLKAERGECGVAAAKSGHHELPLPSACEQPAIGTGQRTVEPDDERAGDIDEQGGPG